jgi:hypothetical protein
MADELKYYCNSDYVQCCSSCVKQSYWFILGVQPSLLLLQKKKTFIHCLSLAMILCFNVGVLLISLRTKTILPQFSVRIYLTC